VKIARVFADGRCQFTPDDDLAFIGSPGLFPPEVDRVHVSCLMTWNKDKAEQLAEEWSDVASVEVGGPAYDWPAGNFEPGMYLKKGYTITSRGCPKKCPFCFVRRREGTITTLPIHDGLYVGDNNLLACPHEHVESVFDMLDRQKGRPRFHGGIDVELLKEWHVERLARLKPEKIYIAFDDIKKQEQVRLGLKMMLDGGVRFGSILCYTLGGYDDDTIDDAESRCRWLLEHGAIPIAQVFRSYDETKKKPDPEWQKWRSRWIWIPSIFGRAKAEGMKVYNNGSFKR